MFARGVPSSGADVGTGLLHLDVAVGTQRITGLDIVQPAFEWPVVMRDLVPASHVAFQLQPPDGVYVDVPAATPVEDECDDKS